MGPAALLSVDRGGSDYTLLAVGEADMTNPKFLPDSLDAIVNRGSIFYLPTDLINECINSMYTSLRYGGRLLLTFKSTEDSRFTTAATVPGSPWRRRLIEGDQNGLELDFFNEDKAYYSVRQFKIRKCLHLTSRDVLSGATLADWVFELEK